MKKINNYSFIKELRKQNKSNDYFEIMLANLSLEELIALKMELAFKSFGMPMYGFPIWQSMPSLCREAILKYSISINPNKTLAARYLGIKYISFSKLLKKYNLQDCYSNKKGDEKCVSNNRSTTKENLS